MSQLIIYKASAGSGKTFRLVAEYLKLLVQNPYNYKHILAVTFTNKATAEMKERILRDLHKLSIGKHPALLKLLIDETQIAPAKIEQHAQLALSFILHDYDRFSVSTIDSFFQRVLRSFAREAGLIGAYEVELDQDAVLNEACDRLLMSIDTDPDLRIWLNDMSEDQLADGKNWQIRDKIIELGKELQKAPFRQFLAVQSSLAEERAKLKSLKTDLAKTKNWFENEIKAFGERGLSIMAKHSLAPADFKGGSRSFTNYFNYWASERFDKIEPSKTALEAIDNYDAWSVQKSPRKQQITDCVDNGLNQCLKDAVLFIEQHLAAYLTAVEVSKHIYALGVLSTLAIKVRETGLEKNSLMLGEADILLKGIIGNNDAPFVYEKAGTFFQNFMIDEFQDTSVVQWDNFRPLIENSLAEDNRNLIVGDVKQSIYRWRNSNWQLLNREIKADLAHFGVQENPLDTNWRSAINVVSFNNTFFSKAAPVLQANFNAEIEGSNLADNLANEYGGTIEQVFADVQQKAKSGIENGFVRCAFANNDDRMQYSLDTLGRLITAIEEVQEQGYGASDIAVLVRNNRDGKRVAEAIINHKKENGKSNCVYEVISDDSLFIQSSPSVRFLVGMLRYFAAPFDKVVQSGVVYEYSTYLYPQIQAAGYKPQRIASEGQQTLGFEHSEKGFSLFDSTLIADYFPFFNDKNHTNVINQMINRPLIDLVNEIENRYLLQVISGEHANRQSFKDVVSDFVMREGGNLHKFLEWWEQFGHKVKLQTANQQNAIRIMTIHKSKGLEFPVVMVPFADWSFQPEAKHRNVVWCSTEATKLNQFPVLPVYFSSNMRKTIFANDYFSELLLSYIDNFNLMYVAFTRAVNGLYIFSALPKQNESKTVSSLLWRMFSDGEILQQTTDDVFEMGILTTNAKTKSEKPSEVNLSATMNLQRNIGETLQIKNNYEDFLSDSFDAKLMGINEGKLLHEILSRIETINDVDKAIETLILEGKIEKGRQLELKDKFDDLFQNELVVEWFSDKYKILNEATILSPNNRLLRPDRVLIDNDSVIVIDYKSSETQSPNHKIQVLTYISKLKEMGYGNVNGYLWYLKTNEVIAVN